MGMRCTDQVCRGSDQHLTLLARPYCQAQPALLLLLQVWLQQAAPALLLLLLLLFLQLLADQPASFLASLASAAGRRGEAPLPLLLHLLLLLPLLLLLLLLPLLLLVPRDARAAPAHSAAVRVSETH
jgi:hypothetical protein